DQLTQTLGRDDEHLARLDDDCRVERRLPGEQVELAEKAARAVHADHPLLDAEVLDRSDEALEHDEEVVGRIALAEEDLVGMRPSPLAVACEQLDLHVAQAGERTA